MKLLLFLSLFLVAFYVSQAEEKTREQQWADFKVQFNRQYANDEEEASRKVIFLATVDEIEAHNKKYDAGEVGYTLGINQFADRTDEENRKNNLGKITLK